MSLSTQPCYSFDLMLVLYFYTEDRNSSSHFGSFLSFPGSLHPLCLLCLINGSVSLVAIVPKSNEVSNGWGCVAVGNWGGGCPRWGTVSSQQWNGVSLPLVSELVKSVITLDRPCFTAHCLIPKLTNCAQVVPFVIQWSKNTMVSQSIRRGHAGLKSCDQSYLM